MNNSMHLADVDGNITGVVDRDTILQYFFTTQVQMTTWNEGNSFNKQIAEFVHSLESTSNGVKKSNIGGYQSDQLLKHNYPPALKHLLNWVESKLVQYINLAYDNEVKNDALSIDAWANINRAGDINSVHCHGAALCSAVYYVTLPKTDDEFGKLILHDPRPYHPYHQSVSITAEQSLLVIFPGWLKHSVNPFRTNGERISIAFNAEIKPT